MRVTADKSSVIIANQRMTATEKSPNLADFYYPYKIDCRTL